MSSREFAEWIALFRLRPYGEWGEDYRIARLAAIIVNVMTRSKRSDPMAKPEDFMPDFEKALDLDEEADDEAVEAQPVVMSVADKVRAFFGPLAAARMKKATPPPAPPHLGTNGEGSRTT